MHITTLCFEKKYRYQTHIQYNYDNSLTKVLINRNITCQYVMADAGNLSSTMHWNVIQLERVALPGVTFILLSVLINQLLLIRFTIKNLTEKNVCWLFVVFFLQKCTAV